MTETEVMLPDLEELNDSQQSEQSEAAMEYGWNVVLWNDNVTPFDVVVAALIQYVELNADQAAKAALCIHNEGKGIVATVDRPKAETIKNQLESIQLTVTLEQVSS